METAFSWRNRRFRPRTGSGDVTMLVYHYQDCKENPKAFYYAAYETLRWKKHVKMVLALVTLYLLLDGLASGYLWIATTPNSTGGSVVEAPGMPGGRDPAFDDSFNPDPDLLHLNYLNDVCIQEKESVISWSYNSSRVDRSLVLTQDMPESLLIQYLSECPDVDIFLPSSIRDHGYCEDGMAYVKYLRARALPAWVFDMRFRKQGKLVTYFDLCPKSALLFMNHYWNDLPQRADFPKEKKIILMPNVEMYELQADHYRRVDYIFAKTQDAFHRINSWYAQQGNPRGTKIIYTQHTSSDPTLLARLLARHNASFGPIKPKNFASFSFLHVNGRSVHKNTKAIMDCWKSRPDFPKLSIYAKDTKSKAHYDALFGSKAPPANIDYHYGEEVGPIDFGKILAEASVILCPSSMEGFGHYINQARAAGALVATTDGFPMNEFVDRESGVLIDAELYKPSIWNKDFWSMGQIMGRHYKVVRNWRVASGMEWVVTPEAICRSVDQMLHMTPFEREARAKEGQQRYLSQMQFFTQRMFAFRMELREVLDSLP
ncbi:hypothetical protein LEN26_020333 [Aphanomyces euteiches]|uniref:Glycosyl transferase family 1 domain-containing protein n=1 Tax=Aphanomyces euteiches TaxID=100861 RepID=A0A6G0WG85_9STRA|nr:hypothetical protein Ae201684_015570 [Aphanomyces euteiches]KAH9084210.1 hypothetical protein Ae201684P_020462 [Aphanomyces euteiches]KAH9086238.1 hypothetical protein LEN26_020333 [Aphanomyces euteiches]KAH9124534.1 hypothetical protein AeMF1_004721 [Aphanomyces euteiches]KAH9144655.1 hypothetical protein AeRB84_011413 [Aphanomyces euteiches]